MNDALGRRIKPTVWMENCLNFTECGRSFLEKVSVEAGEQREYCAACMRQRNNDGHRIANRNFKRRLLLAKHGQ